MSDENVEVVQSTPETVETVATEKPETVIPEASETENPAEKTFTQSEVDDVVGKRLARERRKWERENTRTQIQPEADGKEFTQEDVARADRLIAQREAQRRREEVLERYSEKEEEARSKYDDFEQVAYNPRISITDAMAETIRRSELGPDIAYHLGANPKEADRIARIDDPFVQAKEIGKIEAKLADNPPVKKVSSAPSPIKPISSKSSGAPSYDTTDPRSVSSMSTEEWIKAERQRQIRKMEQGR